MHVAVDPTHGRTFISQDHSDSELFTAESSSYEGEDSEAGYLHTGDKLIVALAKDFPYHPYYSHSDQWNGDESLDWDAILARKLNRILPGVVQDLNDTLQEMCICVCSFRDLQAANVPVQNDFDPTEMVPVSPSPYRMSPSHNSIVWM